MNIILVRHGQTNWNVDNLLQGISNIDLNENGIKQAKQTAEELKNFKIDYIYCSPLNRTVDTANYIANNRNLHIIKDNRLLERSFGNYEGLNGKQLNFKKYWDLDLNLSDNNVESINNFFNRIYYFLSDLYDKYNNSNYNILLVTHNGVNLAISSILCGFKENIFEYNLEPCNYKIFKNIKLKQLEETYGKHKI